jgi:acyl-coenzyme A synthetase/AMP-(fatty) acid ligase
VVNEHDIAVDDVVLIRPGTLSKTTSGKIQRNLTRQLWQQGLLETLGAPFEPSSHTAKS